MSRVLANGMVGRAFNDFGDQNETLPAMVELGLQKNGYNRKDVLNDRVAFFITQLMPGTHTYTHLARVTHAGTFYAPPVQVYLMYAPEMWGRSGSDNIFSD